MASKKLPFILKMFLNTIKAYLPMLLEHISEEIKSNPQGKFAKTLETTGEGIDKFVKVWSQFRRNLIK